MAVGVSDEIAFRHRFWRASGRPGSGCLIRRLPSPISGRDSNMLKTMSSKDDPIALFRAWFDEAEAAEPVNPNACALATADADRQPSSRMVLLKAFDERGFVFYSNLESRKARELEQNPRASLCFYWKSLARQVRIDGAVELVADDEADAYFATRDRDSQIGAWASRQSRVMKTQFDLEKEVARTAARFWFDEIPRPAFWSGYRVRPERIEFWQEKHFRLHERIEYCAADEGWTVRRLYP